MKVPGVKVAGGPVPGMVPTVYGSDRKPLYGYEEQRVIVKKLNTGKISFCVLIVPFFVSSFECICLF